MKLFTVFLFFYIFLPRMAIADDQLVSGLVVSSVEQRIDDEEAPFDIYSSNKVHKCGGKPSNIYRVYSEYDQVALRRFQLALEALKGKFTLSVITDNCEGRVLKVKSLRLNR
ncbi:hypothetical protein NBRC116188_29990 [Oceaniserpentilla sp. 4NH20-0058]|uniref:hypothetical protein n=1 Tax=Oceaniserpentilla sp. 4NH20-0058 TaxID=3127660 RepID=UPI003101D90F